MTKLESLKSIIEEARHTSPTFNSKYSYWVEKRLKAPTHDWLFKNLQEALGKDRLRNHLEEQL